VIAFKSVSVPEVLDDGQRALLCPVNLEPTAPSAASANSIALGYARISKSDFTSSRMAEDMSSLQCAIFADRANSGLSSRSIDRFSGEMTASQCLWRLRLQFRFLCRGRHRIYETPQGKPAFGAIVANYPVCFLGNLRIPGRVR
jgi:hypothetical protein